MNKRLIIVSVVLAAIGLLELLTGYATGGSLAWVLLIVVWGGKILLTHLVKPLWEFISGKHIDELGKALEARVDAQINQIRREVEHFGRNFLHGRTMADYKKAHPECFQDNIFKGCHNCGSKSIWVKQLGITRYGIHNQHICRQCGQALWRSNL